MNRYRVIVLREGTTEDETLFELAGSAVMVGRIVPGALLDVLSADPEAQGETAPPPSSVVADRVFDAAVAAGAAGAAAEAQSSGQPADADEGKTRRPRRTKAQIAADKEAQGLGFRDAAHRAEVESQQQGAAPVQLAYAPPAGEVVVGSVPGPIVTEAPAAVASPGPMTESPDAAPWNPFTQS